NRAAALLAPGGRLVLVGAKQEGIKTFAKSLAARLGGESHTEKHGALYRAELTHGSPAGDPLDDRDYDHLRPLFALGGKPVLSKPGLFGWDRIDPGSALLATALDDFLAGFRQPPARLLDLGCGYGYLSLVAAAKGGFAITATDNCAAALLACRGNFTALGIAGEVVAADAGDALPGPFDAVLCNPPFHQGFQAERGLTEKFLASTRRLLAPKGRALFVVNGFVPLESLAAGLFGGVRVLDNDGRFKVIELASPRSPWPLVGGSTGPRDPPQQPLQLAVHQGAGAAQGEPPAGQLLGGVEAVEAELGTGHQQVDLGVAGLDALGTLGDAQGALVVAGAVQAPALGDKAGDGGGRRGLGRAVAARIGADGAGIPGGTAVRRRRFGGRRGRRRQRGGTLGGGWRHGGTAAHQQQCQGDAGEQPAVRVVHCQIAP